MLMTQAAAPAPFSGNGYTETSNYHSEHQHNGAPLSRRHEYTNARGLSGNAQMIEDRFNTLPSQPPQPQPVTYVQALYDYEADDRTSLSFHEGDIIQVITQLDSGWWDGVINGVRGWFPSNYCQPISNPQDILEERHHDDHDDPEGLDDNDDYDEHFDDDDATSEYDDGAQLPIEGITNSERARADFWIPQATQDGRLFYYNTVTGESREDLPLESPSSATESGPRDRMNVNVPDRTRAPQQMASQRYLQDEDYESEATSATELDGESLMMASTGSLPQRRRSFGSEANGISPAVSMESIGRFRDQSFSTTVTNPSGLASTTSFTNPPNATPPQSAVSRSFFDDGAAAPLTWNRLIKNMKTAISNYKEAIQTGQRSEYVRRAEDISDHLRLLLAAGSGTTDNHSGQPSIISTNKALYPHFRDMMSKFSKLVISSHIAAADWPTPESYQKCLSEADGVLQGVFSYVEVARQQRGEDIPRLLPGFVIGSTAGGSWQNNGLGSRDPMTSNFLDDDESASEPSAVLDNQLMDKLDMLKRHLTTCIKRLEEQLHVQDKIISPLRHETIGNNVCTAAKKVIEAFQPWAAAVESINLSSLGTSFQNPQLIDFSTFKQSLYDSISDLILGCQAVAGPLGDEWAEVRGESLEARLNYVRHVARQLDTNASHIGFSLQLLAEQVQSTLQQELTSSRDSTRPRGKSNSTYTSSHGRNESRQIPIRPAAPSESVDLTNQFNLNASSKVKKFFGEESLPAGAAARSTRDPDEIPDFLGLDHEQDLQYDTKVTPPQLKGGTLLALVEQLTRHDKLESSFNSTFLLTYRSFTTARELFEMLVKRFQVQPPEGLAQADYEMWRDRKQKPIRFRVVNILKSWFDNFWMEEPTEETMRLISDVYTFARDTVKTTETLGSGPLMIVLEQRLRGVDASAKKLVMTLSNSAPAPIMPKNMAKLKFLNIDVTEFARQLTIIESKLYGKIKPTECLNKTWQKRVGEGEEEPAPNVKALILHSNQLTNWVAEMILNQPDVKKRVIVIKHFVSVADKCKQINNFSTLTSIISALGTAPIHRLKRTWDQVPARTLTVLEQMRKLMGSTKNFAEYRETLHLANPPCIPFFGVYLTDLTFIEDGIPSIIKKSSLINFAKRAKTAEVIRDIQQYQNVAYNLVGVAELQEYILGNMARAGDVHEMYAKSLEIEPREREDDRVVRVLAESGFL